MLLTVHITLIIWILRQRVRNCDKNIWSSLIWNTSARHERHERHKYDTSATQKRHEWETLILITIRFLHPYIYHIASERWHGQEKFHSENYFLEIPSSYAKMRLKSAPQKVNFVMAKAISKSYKVDCGCKCPFTFPHSYEASFLKKYLMWHYQHFFFARTCEN